MKSLIKTCKNYNVNLINILIKMMLIERVLVLQKNKFGLKKLYNHIMIM